MATKIIDRFDEYMSYKHLNDNKVTVQVGLSNGTIGKSRKDGRDLSDRVIEQILNFYTDLNRQWLLYGEGEMLRSVDNYLEDEQEKPQHNSKMLASVAAALSKGVSIEDVQEIAENIKEEVIEEVRAEEIKTTVVLTPDVVRDPRVNLKEAFKAGELDDYAKPTQDILPLHHAKVYTYCDDMEPEIRAREPVLVRLLPRDNAIVPGEMYFIDLPSGGVIRYIEKEENGCLYLRARNCAYGDMIIPRSDVQSLAQVVQILRTPRSMSNKETTLAEMIVRKDAHLSDVLSTNNKLIDEICKQNERTGRMIDKLIDK